MCYTVIHYIVIVTNLPIIKLINGIDIALCLMNLLLKCSWLSYPSKLSIIIYFF